MYIHNGCIYISAIDRASSPIGPREIALDAPSVCERLSYPRTLDICVPLNV